MELGYPQARERGAEPTFWPSWQQAIRDGAAFFGGARQDAVVAEFAHVQLFNPLGSNRLILVRRLNGLPLGGEPYDLRRASVALANLARVGTRAGSALGASVAQLRIESNGAQQGTVISTLTQTNANFSRLSDEWLAELQPGEGLTLVGGSTNTAMLGHAEWIERMLDRRQGP